MDEYNEWIMDNVDENPVNQCERLTLLMRESFPELIRVRGHVLDGEKKYPHWWLKTENGDIVDPTAHQFCFVFDYEEWDEARDEPTGKCPNCGEYSFKSKYFCSDSCREEFSEWMGW